jgi:hypothetical protein
MVRNFALALTVLFAAGLAGQALAQPRPVGNGIATVQYQPGGPRWERYQGPPIYRPNPVPNGVHRVPMGAPQPFLAPRAAQPQGPVAPQYGVPPDQIRANVQRAYPGRILSSRLLGPFYTFRILSLRGNIVDVVVDRASGRIVRTRGGP